MVKTANMTGFRITLKTSLLGIPGRNNLDQLAIWECLWKMVYIRLVDMGRPFLIVGSTTVPQSDALDWIKRRKEVSISIHSSAALWV